MIVRYGSAIVLMLASAAAVGWIAFQLQQQDSLPGFFFPLIFPLLVGLAAGGACVVISLLLQAPMRVLPAIGLITGVIVVVAQSWFSYRAYAAEIDRQLSSNALAAAARAQSDDLGPRPLNQFISTQVKRTDGWWIIDAVLIVFASSAVGWVGRSKLTPAPNPKSEIRNPQSAI